MLREAGVVAALAFIGKQQYGGACTAGKTLRTSVCHHISFSAIATSGVQVLRLSLACHRCASSGGTNPVPP